MFYICYTRFNLVVWIQNIYKQGNLPQYNDLATALDGNTG